MRPLLVILSFFIFLSPAFSDNACPRIISQSPYITRTLDWLGLKACIVGVSRYDELNRPRTGGILDPDADAIGTLTPDLMLTSNWITEANWRAAAPEGAKAIRLRGFQRMAEIEDNLRLIAKEVGLKNGDQQIRRFSRQWRAKAKLVNGNGTRALLLSACGGTPYSFGRNTWLYDLFTEAGFVVVETHPKIRHIKPGQETEHITSLINKLNPELIFIFEQRLSKQCAAIPPRTGVRIINLDGDKFLHPAPVLLEGLDILIARRNAWNKTDD